MLRKFGIYNINNTIYLLHVHVVIIISRYSIITVDACVDDTLLDILTFCIIMASDILDKYQQIYCSCDDKLNQLYC